MRRCWFLPSQYLVFLLHKEERKIFFFWRLCFEVMLYRQTRAESSVAFCKRMVEKKKKKKTRTSFTVCKFSNPGVLETCLTVLTKILVSFKVCFWAAISLSEQRKSGLLYFLSFHASSAALYLLYIQQFLKEGSVMNLHTRDQTIILTFLQIVRCQSSNPVMWKKKQMDKFGFFSENTITGNKNYLNEAVFW